VQVWLVLLGFQYGLPAVSELPVLAWWQAKAQPV
jgi:hypothetical protein